MPMANWERFYAHYPLTVGRTDYLAQVGHTLNGKSIEDEEFQLIVSQICDLLDLQESDTLLDLCCGNGLITKELAKKCRRVVGVDFSEPLLRVANQDHCPDNVTYHLLNILEIDRLEITSEIYDKILLFAALQHFREEQLLSILKKIIDLSSHQPVILLGFVPDREKKWLLHNTPTKKIRYFYRNLVGTDRMGTWWDQGIIADTCRDLGLRCSFHKMHPKLDYGRYRFNVRISL